MLLAQAYSQAGALEREKRWQKINKQNNNHNTIHRGNKQSKDTFLTL